MEILRKGQGSLPPNMRWVGSKMMGMLHPSGLNRSQRRAEAAIERLRPQADRVARAEDHADLLKEQRAEKVQRRQVATHARAVLRRAGVAASPSTWTRARAQFQAMLTRRAEAKKRRNASYQLKRMRAENAV